MLAPLDSLLSKECGGNSTRRKGRIEKRHCGCSRERLCTALDRNTMVAGVGVSNKLWQKEKTNNCPRVRIYTEETDEVEKKERKKMQIPGVKSE
jgi:hypothetical protein